MKDKDKTKEQLIGELAEMHQRIARLEALETECKQMEDTLQESEQKYRSLFESMFNGFAYCQMLFDENSQPVDFVYIEINGAFEKLTGLRREDVIGRKVTEAVPGTKESNPELFDIYGKVALTGEPTKFDVYFEPLDIWLNISVYSPQKGYFVAVFENITERKRVEDTLRESEERFHIASQIASDVVYERDLQTGIATFYGDIDSHLGYEPGEYPCTMEGWREHVHPEDLVWFDTHSLDQLEPGVPFSIEYRMRKKDGTYMTWWDRVMLIRDEETGKPTKCIGAATDITERKNAEEALRESEEKYRLLFNSSTNPSTVYDSNCVLLLMNKAAAASLGGVPTDFIGKPISKIHPSIAQTAMERIRTVTETRESREFDTVIDLPSGRHWFWSDFQPVKDANGNVNSVQIISYDITERKKVEEALKESEGKYKALVENATDFIYMIDKDNRVLSLNESGANLFGKAPGELIGKLLFDLFPEEITAQFSKDLKWVFTTGSTKTTESKMVAGGREMWMSTSLNPVKDHKNEVISVMGMTRDITEQIQMRKEIDFLARIVETAPISIIATDENKEITYVNPATEKMFGYTQEELIGKDPGSLNAELNADEIEKNIVEKIMRNEVWQGELLDKKKSGELFNILASVYQLLDDEGNNLALVGFQQDITERKQAEEALVLERENFRNSVDSSSLGIRIFSAGRELLYANQAYLDIYGYSSFEELQATPPKERYTAKSYAEVKERTKKRQLGEPVPTNFEVDIIRKDGKARHLEASSSEIMWGGEKGYQLIYKDITERKQTEDALRQSEGKWYSLVTNAPNIIMLVDGDGTIQFINHAVSDMEAKDIIGKSHYDYIEPEYCDIVRETTNEVFKTGEPGSYQIRGVGPAGSMSWYETKVGPIIDGGRTVALILITSDITERKQIEEEQQKAAKLESVGTLAGGIAHDFNNLLTGITGYIGLAKRSVEQGDVEKASSRLAEAEKVSLQARDLTQQLLTFSRGGAPIKKLASITDLVKESATFALRGSSVRGDFSMPDDLWPAEVDEGQMNQVFNNIIINAVQAMPGGGIINIRGRNLVVDKKSILPLSKGNYIEIEIEDYGTGIPKDHLNRILEPYFTTKQKSSGLGLATAYSIIKNHGGHIAVDSTPTVGTTIRLYLPASKKQVPKKEQEGIGAVPFGKGKVLVMDDEEIIRALLHQELTSNGYEVEVTEDGKEAIERYRGAKEAGQPFDIVILDLTIPGGMGGKEVIKKLLEIDPKVKAIVSSGYATDPVMANFEEYGFKGVIAKPYTVEKLEKVLRSILREKG
ncbi:PAS domain S-box protein [Chloroflexota bacterium]